MKNNIFKNHKKVDTGFSISDFPEISKNEVSVKPVIDNKVSFLEWVISKKDGEIDGYSHHIWNGVTCLEYCKLVEYLIKDNVFWTGVRHIQSPASKSKYELAVIINEIFNLNLKINKVISDKNIDKTLCSIYEPVFEISNLEKQIKELAEFSL